MQTTLLGLAIAIILALVAALVGPIFVDWGQYRSQFEQTASRLTGLEVHIAGLIDARLLPTPTLTLNDITIARPGAAGDGAVQARSLDIEFALNALVRGEWRASNVQLVGAEFGAALDTAGRLQWLTPSMGFDPEFISIERLDIRDSRATFRNASSGSQLVLDKLEFRGEMRSLAGPLKGEGSFVVAGQPYPYRISAGRVGTEGGVRMRLNVEPSGRALVADADGTVFIENGVPRFDATVQFARPVQRTPDGIIEPWQVTSRVRGDGAAAAVEKIEFQYGRDDRPVKLRGDGTLTFGRSPQLAVALTAAQIDVDRMLGLSEQARRRPLAAVKTFADFFGGHGHSPIPVKLGITVENVSFAGATLQRVNGEVRVSGEGKGDTDAWDLDRLEFRAPGATQLSLRGRVSVGSHGIAFEGPAKVETRDPRALTAWLTDRVDAQNITATALRAEGEVKLGSETIAVEHLKADLDRMPLEGSFAYSWASGERPARVDAALTAPDVDVDRLQALAQALFAETAFEWPREGKLALKVGRASLAGIEARRADIIMQLDRQGLEIEKLAIGDFGGATLAVSGRFDASSPSPRGRIKLDFDARSLDGIAAALEKYAPEQAAELRRRAPRMIPARLSASLVVDAAPPRLAGPPSPAAPTAAFKVDGSAGVFRIGLQGDAEGFGETISWAELARLAQARVKFAGRLDASDGGALIELLNLDSLVAVDKRPAWLSFGTTGKLDGDLAVDTQLLAGGLDLTAKGSVRFAGSDSPTAALALKLASANLRSPRVPVSGRPAEVLPTTATAQLALADGVFALSDLTGKVAGTDISGRLRIGAAQPATVDGDLELGALNLPAILAAWLGAPAPTGAPVWATEPFAQGLLGRLKGQIAFKSDRVTVTPKLAARAAHGVLRLEPADVTLADLDGTVAGGQVSGQISFRRSLDGLTARSQLRFANTELAELLPGDGRGPLSGRVNMNIELESTGRSPGALVGALNGSATYTLQDGQILRLDPGSFAAVIRSVDLGLPVDATRIRDRMESTLASGRLAIPAAEGEVLIAAGQARLTNTVVRGQGAEIVLDGGLSLTDTMLDARATLKGPDDAGGPPGSRPEIRIMLKGPLEAPKRTLEVAALTNWLAARAIEQQDKKIDALEAGRELPAGNPYASTNPAVAPPGPAGSATPGAATPPKTEVQRRAAIRRPPPPPAPAAAPQQEQRSLFGLPLDLRPPMQILRLPGSRF